MNWAEIEQLRGDAVPERTITDLVRAHGLDLPHLPGVQLEDPPTVGMPRWQVYCLACTLQHGVMMGQCLLSRWSGPAYLVNPEPMARVVDLCRTAMRSAGP